MMSMMVGLYAVIAKIQWTQGLHICHTELPADVNAVLNLEAAALNLAPRLKSKLRNGLVGFTAQGDITFRLAHGGGRRGRRMRSAGYCYGPRTQSLNPLHGYAKLGRRTTPKKIRRRRRNNQEMRLKSPKATAGFFHCEIVSLSIDEPRLASRSGDLVISKQQLQGNMRLLAAKVCRPFEVPVRIDQSKLHPALPENSVAIPNAPPGVARLAMVSRFSSQNSRSSCSVCSMPICGRQPV